jgi:hypothetical protein
MKVVLAKLTANFTKWSPIGRKAECWAFFKPKVGTHRKTDGNKTLSLLCIVCQETGVVSGSHKIEWSQGSGTSQFTSHIRLNHKVYEKFLRPLLPTDAAKSKSSLKQPTLLSASQLKKSTASETLPDSPTRQQKWIDDQILCFAKDFEPLSSVEKAHFIKREMHLWPSLVIPSRSQFRAIHIPKFYQDTLDYVVLPKLENARFGCLTYDLWMTFGSRNIFAVLFHFLRTDNFQPEWVCLGLVDVRGEGGSTAGKFVAASLVQVLAKFPKLAEKVVAHVSDGGSNLETMRNSLAQLRAPFPSLETNFFVGDCFCHVISSAIGAAFKDANVIAPASLSSESLPLSLHSIYTRLVQLVTWVKKSSPARELWNALCVEKGLKPRIPPSPVVTRMASRALFFSDFLAYKEVQRAMLSPQHLKAGDPHAKLRLSGHEWDVVEVMVTATKLATDLCFLNQTRGYFFLSDALKMLVQIALAARKQLVLIRLGGELGPAGQLRGLEHRMRLVIANHVKRFLPWLGEFDPQKAHNVFAVLLDHRQKGLGLYVEACEELLGLGPDEANAVLAQYEAYLLALLVDLYPKTEAVAPATQAAASHPRDRVASVAPGVSSPVERKVRKEWERYLNHTVDDTQHSLNPQQWWQAYSTQYPTVAQAFLLVGCIPGSEVEVERVFSTAGLFTQRRRSGMGTDMLDMLVFINKNFPTAAPPATSPIGDGTLASAADSDEIVVDGLLGTFDDPDRADAHGGGGARNKLEEFERNWVVVKRVRGCWRPQFG